MESPAGLTIGLGNWTLVCIATLLARLTFPKVVPDANALSIIELLQPRFIPFGILARVGSRFIWSGRFGLRLGLLRNGLRELRLALRLVWTGILQWFWPWGQGCVKDLPAKRHFVQHIVQ